MKARRIWSCLIVISILSCKEQNIEKTESKETVLVQSLVDYVNPLMGTDSAFDLSNGNTYPAIATPWAMNFWTPMTSKMGDGWTYKYDENKLRGIKQTHQPSPWINDYAAFSVMAITGDLKYKEDERASWFSHKAETVKPYYYKVYLADYDVVAEVAPTERAAHFKFTFPKADQSYIMLDAFFKGSMVKIIPEERKIIGYCRNNSGGVPDNFHNYFVAEFDKDFNINHTWGEDWKLVENSKENEGEHVGAIIGFETKKGETVHVKVASSFISPEQAQLNLNREVGNDTFQQTQIKAKKAWEKELRKIKIEDDNSDHIKTFYSCLYRVLLFPRKFYEFNEKNEVVHYSPYNGKVLPGYMFTDNGFWDTFRAVFPFFNMMYPELNSQIMEGLANTYKESGWLPEWASPGHRDCMIGSNSAPIIADAFLKEIPNMDVETLFEAILKNATTSEGRPLSNGKEIRSVGREGIDYYNKLGYVPYDVNINENAARTLEYAYADFTIAKMAEKLGKKEIAKTFYERSKNYKNLFDPTTKLMRGKNEDGSFQSPFNPLKWGDAFTEGNSLHYTWSVFHDIEGLIQLMGGKPEFEKQLDHVFNMPPEFDASYYGFTIHEIREMQIVNMGNYAHGNQPIQHMIYLYNYANVAYKTQEKIREVLTKLYSATPDGYCGDEDNGQTSAWYVFSALGFYPVTPGVNQYVIGSPLFKKATITLENGNEFVINAPENNQENVYIQSALLNGETYHNSYLDYEVIQQGGRLDFKMTNTPNKDWANSNEEVPYSLSKE
ncbi:putative alpha-1,2-mannosidase [Aquimarina sp. EL_43]|uniref:GH92 family glycosyl hydrolase n=1 Tax=unclassified Aquimarina TaxID=2627091 RepID=UPI0018CAEFC6|nr:MULTISPECIES: GH92 family glycosyl hydrolase [unclassified Aquimarina]MBG6130309.1 putative alpha-1,2-mannosidase [Aquimarina sp. EL_35]MBG6149089.1 putative alpha-1,2-mannosidase [Aquimarina sp. EL_32]MBG6168537.1 putative alpha-1,2-mannosidase [Aquimarina sp. EL_43]